MTGAHRAAWVAAGLGAAGFGYRVALLAHDVPPANSDEGTTGLAALHISAGHDFPVFFYGQHYLGAIQAYLAAPFVGLFGTHWWALRIPPLLLFAAFLLLMYRLTARLYTPWFAAFVVGLLALGADRLVKNELIGGGGYPESSVIGAGALLLALWLVGHPRPLGFVGFGLLFGLAIWGHWLLLPYLLMGLLVLAVGHRRALLGRAGLFILAGAAVTAAPLVWDNLTAGPGQDSLSVLRALSGGPAPLGDRLHGGVLVGLPLSTGLCPPGRCTPAQLWFGPLYVGLLVVAAGQAVLAWRRAQERPTQVGRLALLGGAALTLWSYVDTAGAAQTPTESARYLHYGLISLPAVLWPLWHRLTGRVVLAGITATMVAATLALVAAVPTIGTEARDERRLVAALDDLGIDRLYSEYWTCNRLAYVTRERILCAVLDDQFRPGLNRYPPHASLVDAAPRPAYAFPVDEPVDGLFAARLRADGIAARVTTVAGYHVYEPDRRPIQS